MLFAIDVHLSLYATLVLPLLALGMLYFRRVSKVAYVKVRQSLSTLNGFLQEYLSGMPTVQMANQVKASHRDFASLNEDYLLANRQAIFLDATIYSFVDALSYFASHWFCGAHSD